MTTSKTPRGLRGLPQETGPSASQELQALKDEAARIERWWTEPRWKHTQRVYSGAFCLCWLLCVG